jgi:hypothetical protein
MHFLFLFLSPLFSEEIMDYPINPQSVGRERVRAIRIKVELCGSDVLPNHLVCLSGLGIHL